MKSRGRMSVGIFIFDDVEVLDFAGPFEVFSRTRTVAGAESRRTDHSAPVQTVKVARTRVVI
jgi:putative intracellular protease/amidase